MVPGTPMHSAKETPMLLEALKTVAMLIGMTIAVAPLAFFMHLLLSSND